MIDKYMRTDVNTLSDITAIANNVGRLECKNNRLFLEKLKDNNITLMFEFYQYILNDYQENGCNVYDFVMENIGRLEKEFVEAKKGGF